MGGSQSTQKITSQDKAILDLKVQRDKLKQYQKRLQLSLDSEQQAAKQALANGQKSRAITALRQRKYHESLLTKTDNQLATLTELLSTIEFSQIQNQVLQSLNKGSEVLKELQKEMSLERAESIMDRVGEGVAAQKEIDEALMSKLSAEEEESIEAELAALQQEAMPSVPVKQDPVRLPSVPVHQPVEEDAEEERREKEAQREEDLRMAMTA
ncbi:Vacuolar protein sorting-associated protein 20 [Naganishia albida]|nr:Vacuolar protein sorting-associated protein 20 [Naganishia albida]